MQGVAHQKSEAIKAFIKVKIERKMDIMTKLCNPAVSWFFEHCTQSRENPEG